MTNSNNSHSEQEGDQQITRNALAHILEQSVLEQRRTRRWNIFFRLSFLILLLAIFGLSQILSQGPGLGPPMAALKEDHIAMLVLDGPILDEPEAVNASYIRNGLEHALANDYVKAVILRINSPGGSPVQSALIHDEILRLRKLHGKPIYAVATDVCASGAIYVAVAADQIYANPSSLIGSIGVIAGGFGMVGLIEKIGVTRRLLTAGENKALLDPFLPEDEEAKAHIQGILDSMHRQFITTVRNGRGARLKENPDTFSGYIWTGEDALTMGLIDGLGDVGYVAREVIGLERVVDYSPQPDYLERFSRLVGVQLGSTLWAKMTGQDWYGIPLPR